MERFSKLLFTYRSYTPIPFVLIMLLFQQATLLSLIIGFLIALTGELTRFWGVSFAGSETRTTGKVGGTFLVISGPFGYVRNPLYLGNILIYAGVGVMSMSLFPYLQIIAIGFFLFQYYYIILEEEKYLFDAFSQQFRLYFQAVPRLIPRLTPYKNKDIIQPKLSVKAGLKSEKRTLQAFITVVILLVVFWIFKIGFF
jgi:protein-S-isoprenylcysteine O-methyltransferase Ste14